MDMYSGFAANPGLDLEIKVFHIDRPVETLPYKVTIGKPVWLFPTVKNPNRKWWELWKPARVIDPMWEDLYNAARKEAKS